MFHGPKLAKTDEYDDVNEEIEELLTRFDNGEAVGFWHSTRLLDLVERVRPAVGHAELFELELEV